MSAAQPAIGTVGLGSFELTGGGTFLNLVAATTNALNGALPARRPDHYKNFTVVGILLMALLGGIGGGVGRRRADRRGVDRPRPGGAPPRRERAARGAWSASPSASPRCTGAGRNPWPPNRPVSTAMTTAARFSAARSPEGPPGNCACSA
ncbi:hypothetical protein [Streptomyces sp. NPDC102282]|uniref:hypothetical protein n=1 Tax=Streptomyces sp. NPDC102282 TaxID=3366154 RepID=UPI0038113BDB